MCHHPFNILTEYHLKNVEAPLAQHLGRWPLQSRYKTTAHLLTKFNRKYTFSLQLLYHDYIHNPREDFFYVHKLINHFFGCTRTFKNKIVKLLSERIYLQMTNGLTSSILHYPMVSLATHKIC